MTQTSLGYKLRVLRAERGLTLREAASETGVAKETISDIERGIRHPHDVTLSKLARGYSVPVENLLEEPVPLAEAPQEAGPATEAHEWAKAYSARLHGMSDAEWDTHIRGLESIDEIEQELRALLEERENLRTAFDVNKGLNPEAPEKRISHNRRLRDIRTDRLADLASAAAKKKNEVLVKHVMGALLEEAHP